MDCVRAEDAYTSRLGYEEHIPGQVCEHSSTSGRLLSDEKCGGKNVFFSMGKLSFFFSVQTRDWNEELQTTRELPRKNLPERLLRERAIFKVLLSLSLRVTLWTFSLLKHLLPNLPSQYQQWRTADAESRKLLTHSANEQCDANVTSKLPAFHWQQHHILLSLSFFFF